MMSSGLVIGLEMSVLRGKAVFISKSVPRQDHRSRNIKMRLFCSKESLRVQEKKIMFQYSLKRSLLCSIFFSPISLGIIRGLTM